MTWELDGGPEEKSIHTNNLTFLNFRNIEVIITLFLYISNTRVGYHQSFYVRVGRSTF